MGKNAKSNANRDSYLRMNFLYQAAHHALSLPNGTELARSYILSLRSVAKRSVLRLHPQLKRGMCKKCGMLLIPGVTARVRHRGKRQKHIVMSCSDCGTVKRFPSNQQYQLWVEQQQAWVPAAEKESNEAATNSVTAATSTVAAANSTVTAATSTVAAANSTVTAATSNDTAATNSCLHDNKNDASRLPGFHNSQNDVNRNPVKHNSAVITSDLDVAPAATTCDIRKKSLFPCSPCNTLYGDNKVDNQMVKSADTYQHETGYCETNKSKNTTCDNRKRSLFPRVPNDCVNNTISNAYSESHGTKNVDSNGHNHGYVKCRKLDTFKSANAHYVDHTLENALPCEKRLSCEANCNVIMDAKPP